MWRSSAVSNVSLMLSPRRELVPLNRENDDWGLYAHRCVNEYGTPLVVRGTKQEVLDFLKERNLGYA
jgi:hypothetical protein